MEPYETIMIGGREYYLKLTNKNAVKLEKSLSIDTQSEIGTLALYYYYVAASQNDSINSLDDIYQLFDRYISEGGSYKQLYEHLIEALVISGVLEKETPTAAKKAKGNSNSSTIIADIIKEMYNKALEVGLLPSEYWEMSLQEARDTILCRAREIRNEIYSLAAMNRLAVISSFSHDVKFPAPPDQLEHQSNQGEGNLQNWRESKKYFDALAALQRQQQSKQDPA